MATAVQPGHVPQTDLDCLACRGEGEGGVHHSCSRRRRADDSQHADEEHCGGGEKCADALRTSVMKLRVCVIE